MADINAIAIEERQALGAPEGVKNKDLSAGESHEGPRQAVINNQPPVPAQTPEELAAAKEAEAKAEADKIELEKAQAKKAAEEDAALAEKKLAEEAELKRLEEEAAAEAAKKLDYPVYEDPVANSVVNLLKKAGVTPEESDNFFRKAVESGNLDDIDITGLAEKVGKDEADLIMIGVRQYYDKNVQTVKSVVTEVNQVFGGEAEQKTVIAWALEREKTDSTFAGELNEYRKMFDGTPIQAKLAAQELKKAYEADPRNKSLKIDITEGDKPGSNNPDLAYISRMDYVTALKAAEAKRDSTEVHRLNARRMASLKQEKSGKR